MPQITGLRQILALMAFTGSFQGLQAVAAPYAITYTGTMSTSIAGITAGQTYDVTMVVDNGGSTAAGQTWTGAQLICSTWRFNTARNFIYSQDTTVLVPTVTGSVTTNGAGVLTGNFSSVVQAAINTAPGTGYTVIGGSLTTPIRWFANGFNGVFYAPFITGRVDDAAGGVQMAFANWSNPVPFVGSCPGAVAAASVPALPTGGFPALMAALGLAGVWLVRRLTVMRA